MTSEPPRTAEKNVSRLVVVIPAKNERLHIVRCIDSVGGDWPVVVVDGGSEDETVALARMAGATVLERTWTGYADQKNWAMANIPGDPDWILFVDADETLTPELKAEVAAAVQASHAAAFAIPRRFVFLGQVLRHAWWYPDYQMRLFRRGAARFEDRRVHEHPLVSGPVEVLHSDLLHDNLKGLTAFIDRHNVYSDLEAAERLDPSPGRKRGSFFGSRADRRRALKEQIWYRMPFRPLIRFWWMYGIRFGFLDGRRGLLYCRLIAQYEFLIDAKVLERRLGSPTDAPQY